ncbi:MAG: hypothetical protein QOI12_4163 [Alphaproteobacteria bacterium]|jgi:hypothetical protein|nr:hypothetical protein [Alphaproteobacteria bacterium]
MHPRFLIGALALAAALTTAAAARAHDQSKYPDWSGAWHGTGGNKWPAPAPLTAEYRTIYEANLRNQEAGGHGDTPTVVCLPPGMPRQMNVYEPMQIVITSDMVHLLIEHVKDSRRIYTDGRDWPREMEPMFAGFSIGKWEDTDGDGRYDTLVVETRGLKSPRTYDSTGVPMHKDGKTVVKERLYQDKTNPNIIHNEITTIDNALTHPWTITKNYRRDAKSKEPYWWREAVCAENNPHVKLGDEVYMVSADGHLMPTRKDQPSPDLRYFEEPQQRSQK